MKRSCIKRIFTMTAVVCILSAFLFSAGASGKVEEPRYDDSMLPNIALDVEPVTYTISPKQLRLSDGAVLLPQDQSKGYGGQTVFLKKSSSVTFELQNKAGKYSIAADYFIPDVLMTEPIVSVKVNDAYPFYESRYIQLKAAWKDAVGFNDKNKKAYTKDRYGNDIIPENERVFRWQNALFNDNSICYSEGLQFPLQQEHNVVTITAETTNLYIGNITVHKGNIAPSYEEYSKQYESTEKIQIEPLLLEAEEFTEKSDSYIRTGISSNIASVPYDSVKKKINTLSGASCDIPGQSVSWEFNAPNSGLYHIAVKYLQSENNGIPAFKQIQIDHTTPFSELNCYPLAYTGDKYRNEVLSKDGDPFSIYLEEGKHEITLISTAYPYVNTIRNLRNIIQFINRTTISIQKITGNSMDKYRDWEISEYIPDLQKNLEDSVRCLDEEYENLLKLSWQKEPVALNNIRIALRNLKALAENPNSLPYKQDAFSQGSGSVSQLLSDTIPVLSSQSVDIDCFYIYGGTAHLPNPNKGFWSKFLDEIKKLIHSYVSSDISKPANSKNELTVWVNRPVQYTDVIQQMADKRSAEQNTIKANISVMSNTQKLILANASDQAPDVVLGIDSYTPFEISLRGAALDLRQFDDFGKVINDFEPATIVPFVLDDGCYALPETQDFNLLFYRRDILDSLHLSVPQTWDDVVKMLPVLERYGMNFNTQIANSSGFKPMLATSPFIHQFGGEMFSKDGQTSALGSENAVKGFEFMTDLFTRYSLPTDTPNFYNKFRYGILPIGISGFGTYVQLSYAAPEIAGLWSVAPSIGVKNENGTVERWQTGVSTACMVLSSTNDKQESWEFIKWWMNTQTQTNFAFNLQSKFGPSYIWNSANISAFKNSPLPQKDKDVILEQWKWVKEVPRSPAYYMAERALSDAWNRTVMNGESPRVSLDKAIMDINRETKQKMIEFGYLDEQGNVLKPYRVADVDSVKSWRE